MALLALLALSNAQTPAAPPAGPFTSSFEVVETRRLMLTPILDGIVSTEEWDALSTSGGFNSYFQWEPGRLHFAGELPKDQDLVVSIDVKGNGWVIGRDNIEVRLSLKDGKSKITTRRLNCADPNAPQWETLEAYDVASESSGVLTGDKWVGEMTLIDPGEDTLPMEKGDKIAIRYDLVPTGSAPTTELSPRLCQAVDLAAERAAGLPEGLRWGVEGWRLAVPGGEAKLRFTFNGDDRLNLRRFEVRSEGLARPFTNLIEVPFPKFDNKKRAFVDYQTRVVEKATRGYRILRGTLTSEDGGTAVFQASYRLAPLVDFNLVPEPVKTKEDEQTKRMTVFLRSNSENRVDGYFRILPPEGFDVRSGSGKNFIIYNARGGVRRVFDLEIPAKVKGTFPLKFQANIGGKIVEQERYVTIN